MWPRENYDWFEGDRWSWDTANIMQFFARSALIDWSYVSRSGRLTHLSSKSSHNGRTHPMRELLNKYPNIVTNGMITEQRDRKDVPFDVLADHQYSPYHSGGRTSGGIPDWDFILANDKTGTQRSKTSLAVLDLANSASELQRTLNNPERQTPLSRLALSNWFASRGFSE